jgi:hypothetical protein
MKTKLQELLETGRKKLAALESRKAEWDANLIDVPRWMHVVALWACVLAPGLAVVLAYSIDGIANRVRMLHELEECYEARKEA